MSDPQGAARRSGAIEAVERILNREGEADVILRSTVAVLAERFAAAVGLRFVEEGELVLGPAVGTPTGAGTVPVRYGGRVVAEFVTDLVLDGADLAAFERVATLVSPYCLVGWDTGGESWDP